MIFKGNDGEKMKNIEGKSKNKITNHNFFIEIYKTKTYFRILFYL